MAPTPTLPEGLSRILGRQQPTTTVFVSADGGSSTGDDLSGGEIAGIVIGSIVGLILLLWIIWACTRPRGPGPDRQGWYDDSGPPPPMPPSRSPSRERRRHHHHHHHHHGGRRHRSRSSRRQSRRRSSTPRPVVIEEKNVAYALPNAPPSAYYVPGEGRRSRSRSQGRYYVSR